MRDTKDFAKVWKEREAKRSGTFLSKKDKEILYRQKLENKYSKPHIYSYRLLKNTGTFITFLALGLTIVILFPLLKNGTNRKAPEMDPYKYVIAPTPKKENIEAIVREAESYGIGTEFSVAIPKISAFSNVIENVDPNNETEYLEALKEGIAHTKGTYFPGYGKNIYLFSHSTGTASEIQKYNAVFYDLKKLDIDDEIIVFFRQERFLYKVTEVTIVEAGDTSYIFKDFGKEILVMQTCDPPGTSWRRLLLIAEKV